MTDQTILASPSPGGNRAMAIVVERYPRPSETFIRDEIDALAQAGWQPWVLPCVPSFADQSGYGPRVRVMEGPSAARRWRVLARELVRRPGRLFKVLGEVATFVRPTVRGGWLVLKAVWLALGYLDALNDIGTRHVHAHFLNLPSLVAVALAHFHGLSVSGAGHGRDVFVPAVRIGALTRTMETVMTCSRAAHEELLRRGVRRRHLHLVPHGVDLQKFAWQDSRAFPSERELSLITVARSVEKKGLEICLEAVALLRHRGWTIRYRMISDGPLTVWLLARAQSLGIALDHRRTASSAEVVEWFADSDAFLLGCRVADDGDRDGIPNVILEAMACGLPVCTSVAGGVGEVVDEETAWPAEHCSGEELADALESIVADIDDWTGRRTAARARLESKFDGSECLQRRLAKFGEPD